MNKYTDDDWTLICRISDGDEEAMKVLVHRYWPLVFRTSLRIVCDRHEAEDISQEVFIRVWKSAGRFDRNGSITAWIYRITCNRATDILRKKKIFPSYKKKQDETSRADSETSPEERLIASEEYNTGNLPDNCHTRPSATWQPHPMPLSVCLRHAAMEGLMPLDYTRHI